MTRKDEYFNIEEEFHSGDDKKYSRKERKIAIEKDRSKYKKTDIDQLKNRETLFSAEDFPEAKQGRVLAIYPEGIIVDKDGALYTCTIKGFLKKEKSKSKNLLAVGDFVLFEEKENTTGSICYIKERRSVLSRADNLLRKKEQLIAVNIDQVIITCSVLSPAIKPSLIDRYLIATEKGNMSPVIVINKVDLLSKEDLFDPALLIQEKDLLEQALSAYRSLHIPIICVSTDTGEGIEELKKIMKDKASVFSGQSGVGKSSLINAVTGSSIRVGDIARKTSKGSHTTTTTHLLPLECGGFCIDTPGIKSFGLWDMEETDLQAYYPEFSPYLSSCKYSGCTHRVEPDCAVQKAVEEGKISSLRFASYCALMGSLETQHRHR